MLRYIAKSDDEINFVLGRTTYTVDVFKQFASTINTIAMVFDHFVCFFYIEAAAAERIRDSENGKVCAHAKSGKPSASNE